jgi:omega-6 fatty acid desaturase (delta-12 desaturase)
LAALAVSALIGVKAFVLIQLTVSTIAGGAGIWLFYVQHQFQGAYWQRTSQWNYLAAALEGSSFYKLPRILQWFSGNIGFHHVHHLSPRIPNYNLQQCHDANSRSLFERIRPITLLASLKSLTFRLWDEARQMYVGF